ncbi:MAG TPA: NifB/NifX family molybdenum-iron cluster-binding protein [Sumerlaeia bacterium]|nr:NifB/NifX family molybdenum-iron cluster-binding protein [Sumerlaeia bacterium]
MKVAVTSQGEDLDTQVDPRFGRARNFVVVDTETGAFETHDNAQNLNASQGAGIQAARNVVEMGVNAVITGNVGPKAFAALQAGNVQVHIGAGGSVRQALEDFKAGRLQSAKEANVEGRWV